MTRTRLIPTMATLLLATSTLVAHAQVQKVAMTAAEPAATVMVGGQAMYPTKTIVANAVNSADHTTLVAAVKAAGLVDALNGKGPLTVFAPTNEAFAALPAGTVETLLKPENKAMLVKILENHVVAGDYGSTDLRAAIIAGHGKVVLKTLAGTSLTIMMNGTSNFLVKDDKGGIGDISIADVNQSNGVIHVVDKVLLPAG